MQKRQEVLKRLAGQRSPEDQASLRRLFARRLARLSIYKNGTMSSKLLRSGNQSGLYVFSEESLEIPRSIRP